MIEFALPWAFALLPLPVVALLFKPYREQLDALRVPFFQSLASVSHQAPGDGALLRHRSWPQTIWHIIAWILLVCAASSPQWLGEPIERSKSARDLMVAVDLSGSMQTQDFFTSTVAATQQVHSVNTIDRLSAVKSVLAEFAQQRQHDRLGLIVFGDAAFLQSPFTEDHNAWLTLLNETEIGMAGQSTMFGDAIGLALKLFDNSTTDNRVLIVLTDGNDTGSKVPPIEAAKVAAQKQLTIYTIAIGDPKTVGEEALDVDVLKRVAKLTGGHYYQALDHKQLLDTYRDIDKLEPELFESLSYRPKHSLFHWPLAIVCLGQLLQLLVLVAAQAQESRVRTAS